MRRADYLQTTLHSLAGLAGLQSFALIVSQDGQDRGVAELVQQLGPARFRPPAVRRFEHWQHPRKPLLGATQVSCPGGLTWCHHAPVRLASMPLQDCCACHVPGWALMRGRGCLQPGHAWLSQHYKWALDRVFLERGHSHVVIVEDDMVFSPDFLILFQACTRYPAEVARSCIPPQHAGAVSKAAKCTDTALK